MGVYYIICKTLQYILSPIVFIVFFIPIYFYRLFIILVGKCVLPSGSEIIELRNAMFSPCFSALSPMGAILAPYLFKDPIDMSKIFDCFVKHVEKHPRLRSTPILFGLYSFWVPVGDDEFSLKNHIKEISLVDGKLVTNSDSKTILTTTDLRTINKLLLDETFPKGQSPWMMYVIRDILHETHGKCDVAIFKWHHGLADGLSITKMLGGDVEGKISPPNINFPTIPGWISFVMSIKAVFCILEHIFNTENSTIGKCIVSPAGNELKRGSNFYIAESTPISIDYIKSIKNQNNVSFNTVVLTALSSALKTYVLQKGENKETKVPDSVSACIVLPFPGHPDHKLGNHWSWTIIPLPVASPTSDNILQKVFSLLKNSKENAIMAFKRVPIFGGLPFLFHGGILRPHSIAFSDFPGPTHKINIYGAECVDMSFHINIPPSVIGIFCTSLSYDGKWKFAFTIDGSVAQSQQDADNLANSVASYITEMMV